MNRTVFLYWVGKEYKLINILRNLIYLHSTNGKGYTVNLITRLNLQEYISNIPSYFDSLLPAHQADYVRVNVICNYGGIWLDSDTLVLDSLDSLFDILEKKDGFFIKENNKVLCNGIFGSKKETALMIKLKETIDSILNLKENSIKWCEIGSSILKNLKENNNELYYNYQIFNGLDTIYPVNWDICPREYIEKPYDNYKTIIRDYQPLIILVNSVYKLLENKTDKEILQGNMPLNYFINKSLENMKLIDYDFIEIGTSNFDTLIQNSNDDTVGISVDAVKYYIDNLPNKKNVLKIHSGISSMRSKLNVYYIPEELIKENNLPEWFKGCNSINTYHPLHIKYNITHLCKIERIDVIPSYELFYTNKVKGVTYLKIDTEGHDTIILKSLYSYLRYLPSSFFPKKITFETNENSKKIDVDEIIELYCSLGYTLKDRGYDTTIIYVK
jgi:hypothetical protein